MMRLLRFAATVLLAAAPALAEAATTPAVTAATPVSATTLAPPGAAPPAASAASAVLTPAEIKTMFGTGKPFTAVSSPGGKTYTFTLKPDGSAVQMPKGSTTTATTGTWRVNDKGYCSKWGTNAEHCYIIVRNGKSYDVKDDSGHVVSHWKL